MRTTGLIIFLFIPAIFGFNGWDDYHEHWSNNHADPERLFPYGILYYDSQAISGVDANIKFSVPFAGRLYSSIHIAEHGNFELSSTSPATHTDNLPATDLPVADHPIKVDSPMIAAWFATIRMGTTSGGSVFWRRLDPSEDPDANRRNITEGFLSHIGDRIERLFLEDMHCNLTAGLIATWEDVIIDGCFGDDCYKNTFQLVLVTDGHDTYAVFNMYKLEWVGSVYEGCNPSGVPTESNNCIGAQVGVNVGDAMEFYQLPFSRKQNKVLSLAEISGDDTVLGRYVYHISNEKIRRGGCTNDTIVDSQDWPLEIWPRHGSLFGGNDIYFTGPCIYPSNVDEYWCQFGDSEEEFKVQVAEGEEMPVGKCTVPRLNTVGEVTFRVYRKDNLQSWHNTYIATIPDEHRPHEDYKVHLNNEYFQWHQAEPELLSLTWNPHDMYDRRWNHANDTQAEIVTVRIIIAGYFEWREPGENGEMETKNLWQEIHELEASYPNHRGYFEFNVDEHQCSGGASCEWPNPPPVGFIFVMPQNHEEDRRRLSSPPTPVSWYVRDHLRSKYGPEWTEPYCEDMFGVHPEPAEWIEELSPCPATASQARTEIGRFIVGPICNDTEPCPRGSSDPRPHVVHECFYDVTPLSSRARCCYDNLGDIVDALDNEVSSTSDFASPRGCLPFDKPGHHPVLSHWIWDNIYRMACCKWVDDPKFCIDHFNTNRPTPKIQNYHPPGIGVAYGDPHYRTFDGLEYLFNGRGEFWILKVNSFHSDDDIAIQARFQQPPREEWGEVNGTIISGIAFQEGYANDIRKPRVEFHLNFDDASKDNALLVYVNGAMQDFSQDGLRIQEFKDMDKERRLLIMNNSPDGENDQSNFTVAFQNGVAAQVSTTHRAIQITVVLPEKYFDKTNGLLGDWDDDISNDLRNSAGTVVDPNKGRQEIHEAFGMSWEIKSDESRFTYRAKLDWEHYRNPDFLPAFDEPFAPNWPPEGSDVTEEDVDEACGREFVCRFDFKTTMNKEVGVQSLHTHNWTREMSEMAWPIHTCGRPEVEHSIFEYDNYLVAGSVEFTGCESGYTLQGTRNFLCETSEEPVEASWQPSISKVNCKSNQQIKDEEAKLATAIAVPICLIAVIAGVSVGGFFYMRNKKKKDSSSGGSGTSPKAGGPPMSPTDDHNTSMASSGSADLNPRPTTFSGQPHSNGAFGSQNSINSQASITGAGDLGVTSSDTHSGQATPVPYAPISMNPGHSQGGQRTSQVSWAPENQSGRTTPQSYFPLPTGNPNTNYENSLNLNPAYDNSTNDLRASQTSLNNGLHGSRQSLHSQHSIPDTIV